MVKQNMDRSSPLERTSPKYDNGARDTFDDIIEVLVGRYGEQPFTVEGDVDAFRRAGGNETGLRAAMRTTEERRKGYGYLRTLLKNEKFIEMGDVTAEPKTERSEIERLHARYHNAQANPEIDTAAKRLARKAGLKTVRCPCGELHNVMQEGS